MKDFRSGGCRPWMGCCRRRRRDRCCRRRRKHPAHLPPRTQPPRTACSPSWPSRPSPPQSSGLYSSSHARFLHPRAAYFHFVELPVIRLNHPGINQKDPKLFLNPSNSSRNFWQNGSKSRRIETIRLESYRKKSPKKVHENEE